MNKCALVLGVAAVATLAGCKDPDYKYANQATSQEAVKIAEPTPVEVAPVAPAAPIAIETVPVAKCTCPPGTRHETPCACMAPDCRCVVEPRKIVVPEAKSTIYVVKRGDSLSKISKKFNIRLAALRNANPKLKGDVIRIGQKLTIPAVGGAEAKVEAPKNVAPAKKAVKSASKATAKGAKDAKPAKAAKAKKPYAPYTGETKEYVVKGGDTLGSVAYSNGLSIRQLKELNGLAKNDLKIGQKLKVPAAAPAKAEPVVKEPDAKVAEKPVEIAPPVIQPETTSAPAGDAPVAATDQAPATPPAGDAAAKPADPATTSYVVQEGDDMPGISIRFGTSAARIREINNLADDAPLAPGSVLKIPVENQQ